MASSSVAHPLVPRVVAKPASSQSKELVLSGPAAVALESLFVVASLVAAPVLFIIVMALSAYKSSVGWMRTSLKLW